MAKDKNGTKQKAGPVKRKGKVSANSDVAVLVDSMKYLVDAVVDGKLDTRADVKKVDPAYWPVLEGVNRLIDAFVGPINVTAEYVDRVSKGDIPEPITDEYHGDFNEIKNNLNLLIDAVNGLVGEAAMLADAAAKGDVDTRGDAAKFGGDFGTIVQGMNNTMDGVAVPLKDIGDTLDRMAGGDLKAQVTNDYEGAYNVLKVACNELGDQLNGVQKTIGDLQKAIVEGKLDTRGDASGFKGDIAGMVSGLNNLINAFVAPIKETAHIMGKLAQKDLSEMIHTKYNGQFGDLKEDINTALENLKDALIQAGNAGEQVNSASEQVSSASQALAEGASEQAASLEETSSALEEMASMVKQNADNANQANTLMQDANQIVDRAKGSMADVNTAMEGISGASQETQKIIKTIDEIAFQTNLLALNAAVEAARAGEAGAGFAVVADEVRNLAMRAAEAAKNTADLIEGTVKQVDNGSSLVKTTNEAFEEVATAAAKVGELVGEISAASNEQATGIEQVNKAVAEMDKVTQQNAATAEEAASASEELSAQANELDSMLGEFELGRIAGARKAASKQPSRRRRAKPARRSFKRPLVAKKVSPEAVIPLDTDELIDGDFEDF